MALKQAILWGARTQSCPLSLKIASPHRLMSALSTTNLEVNLDSKSGVAVVKMVKKPVNSLDQSMLTDLFNTFEKLDSDKTCRGVILTSGVPRMFSAGLDLSVLYQPSPDKFRKFWSTLQDLWIKLYGSRLATVAAINGHAPAGGCLLALSCDYRIISSGKITIGLNETLLGFSAPFWFMNALVNTIGFRKAEEALKLGRLFAPEEALQIGLVDEVVAEAEVLNTASKAMERYLQIPDNARAMTKSMLRQPSMQRLVDTKTEELENVLKGLSGQDCQTKLGLYIQALKERKK